LTISIIDYRTALLPTPVGCRCAELATGLLFTYQAHSDKWSKNKGFLSALFSHSQVNVNVHIVFHIIDRYIIPPKVAVSSLPHLCRRTDLA
jgi:hypothetical protein